MVDPVTIVSTCVEVVSHVWTLQEKIKDFIVLVREARADMVKLTSELSTLSLSLSMLQDDCAKIEFPESVFGNLSADLEDVLKKCGNVTKEIIDILNQYMSADFLPKLRWATNGRDRVEKLKHRIEGYTGQIRFALMVGEVVYLKSIKEDTSAIKRDTILIPDLKADTTSILKLLTNQRGLSDRLTGREFVMQRFYDEMTTTAESVADEMELVSMIPAILEKSGLGAADLQDEEDEGVREWFQERQRTRSEISGPKNLTFDLESHEEGRRPETRLEDGHGDDFYTEIFDNNIWQTHSNADITSTLTIPQRPVDENTESEEFESSEKDTLASSSRKRKESMTSISIGSVGMVDRNSMLLKEANLDEKEFKESDYNMDNAVGDDVLEELVKDQPEITFDKHEYCQTVTVHEISNEVLLENALLEVDESISRMDQISRIANLLEAGAGYRFGVCSNQGGRSIKTGLDGALEAEIRGAGRPEVVEMLTSRGAKAWWASSCGDLLVKVVRERNLEVAKFLFENGARLTTELGEVFFQVLDTEDEKLRQRWASLLLQFSEFPIPLRAKSIEKVTTIGDVGVLSCMLTEFKKNDLLLVNRMSMIASTAAETGRTDISELLLSYKADPTVDAFLNAAKDGSRKMVELLLDYGVDINSCDHDDSTVLHFACHGGHVELVESLLQRGADPSLKSKSKGNTPKQVAQNRLQERRRVDMWESQLAPRDPRLPRTSQSERIIELLKEAEKRKKEEKGKKGNKKFFLGKTRNGSMDERRKLISWGQF